MICLTGTENSVESLQQRIQRNNQYDVHEIRLDFIESADPSFLRIFNIQNIIVTCRSISQGGTFGGTHKEHFEVLRKAIEYQPAYLDVDLSLPEDLRFKLWEMRRNTKLITSWHSFSFKENEIPIQQLLDSPSDVLKIAITVDDCSDLETLFDFPTRDTRPVIKIGMGAAGILSRILYKKFGSPWTYIVPKDLKPVAPGQLNAAEAELFQLRHASTLTPLALVGGSQVYNSPGPKVYNMLFKHYQLPYMYLPLITKNPQKTVAFLKRLGFRGCSITMPAKETLFRMATKLLPPAAELGAINTLLLSGAESGLGCNTDVSAVQELLSSCTNTKALVLGAGGAACAAIVALQKLNCDITITNRHGERATALAQKFNCAVIPWQQRHTHHFEIAVNTTPMGGDGVSNPLDQVKNWNGRIALDAVYVPNGITPLLNHVKQNGGKAISGLQWWLHQGQKQMEILINHTFSIEQMERSLNESNTIL